MVGRGGEAPKPLDFYSKVGAFKWTVFRKDEILSLLNNSFKSYPSRSAKQMRLNMIPKFYELRGLHAAKAWKIFSIKWGC
jgi:hypothetical protein